ncbi:AAA family ATPase [bacterium]|nr:AAA family ATPase [bacterium]
MLKSIKLTNFFSFKETTVELHPEVNLLIGINGSGKSNLLKAIKLLKEGVTNKKGLSNLINGFGGFEAMKFFGNNKNQIGLEFEFEKIHSFKENVFYEIQLSGVSAFYTVSEKLWQHGSGFIYLEFDKGKGVVSELASKTTKQTKLFHYTDFDLSNLAFSQFEDPERYFYASKIKKAIQEIGCYDYFDTRPKSELRTKLFNATSETNLQSEGNNLSQTLNSLKIRQKPSYKKIIEALQKVNPNFNSFDFNVYGSGNIELLLEEEGLGKSVQVAQVSDGTLRFLCLLAILYNPERGSLVYIDEPEVSLHPDMLSVLANVLEETKDYGQVLIATHSDHLVDCFSFENIKVFEKDETNSTIVKNLKEKDFENWYDEFSLGKMWRKGDLGGNRW